MEKEYSPRLAGVNPKLGDNHEFPHSPREPGTRFKETVTAFCDSQGLPLLTGNMCPTGCVVMQHATRRNVL